MGTCEHTLLSHKIVQLLPPGNQTDILADSSRYRDKLKLGLQPLASSRDTFYVKVQPLMSDIPLEVIPSYVCGDEGIGLADWCCEGAVRVGTHTSKCNQCDSG